METILSLTLLAIAALATEVLVAVITAYPVMLLWNAAIPQSLDLQLSLSDKLYT